MKRLSLSLSFLFCTIAAFCQTPTTKITLTKGQQVNADITVDIEASMSMGMEIISKSSSLVNFEVKDVTGNTTMLDSRVKKLKIDIDLPGKAQSYDSEKPEDQNTDLGKALSSTINTPIEVNIDNTSGKLIIQKTDSPEREEANPMESIMQMFGGAVESGPEGLFILIPQGKRTGDSWMDSTSDKASRSVRTFTLKTISGNEAIIQLNTVNDVSSDVEMQGMKFNITTSAKTAGDIVVDIITGVVKKKNTVTETTGTMQIMGQEMPINAKTTFNAVYK